MNRLPMSRAAAALLRAILQRVGAGSEHVLLTDVRSVEWQSLTFSGERHRFDFRLLGADRHEVASSLADGIGEFEFAIPGQIVADIGVAELAIDRSLDPVTLTIEALTIED